MNMCVNAIGIAYITATFLLDLATLFIILFHLSSPPLQIQPPTSNSDEGKARLS